MVPARVPDKFWPGSKMSEDKWGSQYFLIFYEKKSTGPFIVENVSSDLIFFRKNYTRPLFFILLGNQP